LAAAIKAEVDGAFEDATNALKLAVVCDLNVEADTDFPRPTTDFGTIHLRRRHFLGGRGQKLAKFADG
jgi:hypothetical protein